MGNVWQTLYVGEFNHDEYLYHYTSFDTMIKILFSDSLLFSPISKTNDPSESKTKLLFVPERNIDQELFTEQTTKIVEYFNRSTPIIQLLCMSSDISVNKEQVKQYAELIGTRFKLYDYSGRGFSRPRMWAQYADNGTGACLIFNKEKLIKTIQNSMPFTYHKKVEYKEFYQSFNMDSQKREQLYNQIKNNESNPYVFISTLQQEEDFRNFSFFEKLNDWESEHEFRIIVLSDSLATSNTRKKAEKISSCLEGIVLGENAQPVHKDILKLYLRNKKINCDVKQITFNSFLCTLN